MDWKGLHCPGAGWIIKYWTLKNWIWVYSKESYWKWFCWKGKDFIGKCWNWKVWVGKIMKGNNFIGKDRIDMEWIGKLLEGGGIKLRGRKFSKLIWIENYGINLESCRNNCQKNTWIGEEYIYNTDFKKNLFGKD